MWHEWWVTGYLHHMSALFTFLTEQMMIIMRTITMMRNISPSPFSLSSKSVSSFTTPIIMFLSLHPQGENEAQVLFGAVDAQNDSKFL